jgi:hypothetical protein
MRAPAGQEHAPNRSAAYQAGLPGAHIDAMLELEEAFLTGRIHIIRNRRPTQRDCLCEDALHAGMEAIQFGSFQPGRHSARADAGAE